MQLSEYFALEEFTRSSAADRLGDPNTPTAEHLANLKALAIGMEQVRALFGGKPVQVNSAYRNPRVNASVGGVPTSAHALGFACDFEVPGLSLLAAAEVVRAAHLTWDQLILEPGRCVHVSFDPRERGQVLTQFKVGGRVYPGLIIAPPRA